MKEHLRLQDGEEASGIDIFPVSRLVFLLLASRLAAFGFLGSAKR